MLTYNIDTCDSLTNGTFGTVVGFQFNEHNEMTTILVQFDNESCGKQRRKNYTNIQRQYFPLKVTPIEKIEFQYSLSKKPTTATTNVSAIQFPLKLAFAATSHKIQGSTIKKPNMLIIDLRTVMESAQAYVMLSRVQALSQLIILESVPSHKIYASTSALNELNRMTDAALDIDSKWRTVVSCNIRSLSHNFQAFATTPCVLNTSVICLQETWLRVGETCLQDLNGFQKKCNNAGRGKGIITFFRDNYTCEANLTHKHFQMTKISSPGKDVINVYRSRETNTKLFIKMLLQILDFSKTIILVGDLNICSKSESHHYILRYLEMLNFEQLIQNPTHAEGRHIDHALVFYPENSTERAIEVNQQSCYFTDHDILLVDEVSYGNERTLY